MTDDAATRISWMDASISAVEELRAEGTRIGDAAAERVSSGESICDVAASAFLSEDELRRDYL